ncbi:MAG: hypothetical protein AB7Q97_14275 [Gammaproteobacteria bacterium]
MPTLNASGLTAAYVLIALLLVALLVYSRWTWKVKAAAIAIVTAFYFVAYHSVPPLLGWPTGSALPQRFKLVAAFVREPDKATGASGAIYLWATDMLAGPGADTPRAYRLPFTPELHTRVVDAREKLRKNMPQLGEIKNDEERTGPPGRPGTQRRPGQESVRIEFFDLPDPLFPEK